MCFDFVALVQGLLRELYKAQGHSTAGSMDWDWNKFDSSPGSSRSDNSSGGGVVTTAAGDDGAVEATAGPALGLAASTAAEGITSRTQVLMAELTRLRFSRKLRYGMVGRECKLKPDNGSLEVLARYPTIDTERSTSKYFLVCHPVIPVSVP